MLDGIVAVTVAVELALAPKTGTVIVAANITSLPLLIASSDKYNLVVVVATDAVPRFVVVAVAENVAPGTAVAGRPLALLTTRSRVAVPNVAVAVSCPSTFSVQSPFPAQAPLHAVNTEPVAPVAVSTTGPR
jgi:hypothetical protein